MKKTINTIDAIERIFDLIEFWPGNIYLCLSYFQEGLTNSSLLYRVGALSEKEYHNLLDNIVLVCNVAIETKKEAI